MTVVDNLTSGDTQNLRSHIDAKRLQLVERDLKSPLGNFNDPELVFHFAANPEVRSGSINPQIHFEENVLTTFNLLERVRKAGIKCLVFASTSTVYGEATEIPTPEDYGPLKPISTYGASKLACESLISAYANTFGFRAVILRFANIVGSRSRHGIIYDFVQKLRANPAALEILGDGTQQKSYLHVKDAVKGVLDGVSKSTERVEILNIGSKDRVSVMRIADIVCREMGTDRAEKVLKKVTEDGRGWVGDVKMMMLDVSRLEKLGWKPELNSVEAVELATKELVTDLRIGRIGPSNLSG